MRRSGPLLLALSTLITSAAMAQDTGSPSTGGLRWHALVMSSYQFDTHQPGAAEIPLRVFDREQHAWRFDLAGLSLSRSAAPLGFQFDLVSGADVPVMASLGAPDARSLDFTQAFVAWRPSFLRGTELRAGKFVTTAGFEVIPTWDNPNITQSRSFLFGYAIPFTHTGMRALVPLGSHAQLVAGVNRGWDRWKDDNDALSSELALTLTPSARWTLAVDAHRGAEQPDNTTAIRRLLDVSVTYLASDRWTLGANVDQASEDGASVVTPGNDASWHGVALYARTVLTPRWALGTRVERFADPDGARTGIGQTLSDLDLTLDWTPDAHVMLRGDLRADHSTDPVFPREHGADVASRTTLGLALIYRH